MKGRIGITIGDPAGIGPEVSLKAISALEVQSICHPVLIGDREWLRSVARQIGRTEPFPFEDLEYRSKEGKKETILFHIEGSTRGIPLGRSSREGGEAAAKFIEAGVRLALENKIEALVTAPISKASLNLAGYQFSGHTDFLASLTQSKDVLMMFYSESIKVALLTTHLSLQKAIAEVKKEKIIDRVTLLIQEFERLFRKKPRIAVCGLNPHAGEMGLFGQEEEKEIRPAIEVLRRQGMPVSGPYAADTLFAKVMKKRDFDLIFSLYHDQGLIAMKSLDIKSVNMTLGLPFIRTSPDHGTAFDIAGKNLADPSSMIYAIQVAAQLSKSMEKRPYRIGAL